MKLPRLARHGLVPLALILSVSTAAGAADYWHETAPRSNAPSAARLAEFRRLELDRAPLEAAIRAGEAIALPLPEGGFAEFTLRESGTMAPELAARFPELLSLAGRDAHGRRVRVDLSPAGLAVMIFADEGTFVIQPETPGSDAYLVFDRAFYQRDGQTAFECGVHEAPSAHAAPSSGLRSAIPAPDTVTGPDLRTYRLALAATGEYTTAVCAPNPAAVSCGLAAMVTTVNRVNEVYETDVAVHLQLIANTDLLIYTDGGTDPYSNNNGSTMLGQNQTTVTNVIGAANYDVGHVFSTGGGGVASLGVTCVNGSKARGVTGSPQPWGDPYDIDYVAHEMGHQFGANHTFNGTTSSCGGGNRSAAHAYEPGSGSTIMAYAGICGSQNLQSNSDPYFHAESLREIINNVNGDAGSNCPVVTTVENTPPQVETPQPRTIPARTPFLLEGSASDVDGDVLTYDWEQYDLGSAQSTPDPVDDGARPILRSWNPTVDPVRIVPRLSTLLGGPAALGEVLPTAARASFTFRLTVRDNADVAGATNSADMEIAVVDTGTAFAVTAPPASEVWQGSHQAQVQWNVAGTTAAPISCASVDIGLSTDGGVSFTESLATGVPNSGAAIVIAPQLSTTQARVRVRCSNNIFFNISPGDFAIEPDPDFIFGHGFE